jgi:hypothetical protein
MKGTFMPQNQRKRSEPKLFEKVEVIVPVKMADVERILIDKTLAYTQGDKAKASIGRKPFIGNSNGMTERSNQFLDFRINGAIRAGKIAECAGGDLQNVIRNYSATLASGHYRNN